MQVLLNLAASHTSSHAVRNAGIAMVLQSLIHSVTQVTPPHPTLARAARWERALQSQGVYSPEPQGSPKL